MRKLSQGIDVDKLNQVVKDLGVRVRVYKSTLCPNMTSLESADHDITCKVCNNGMIDFEPFETIAMFQQQSLTDQFKVQGTFHIDEIFATFLSGISLQVFTKVEILDFKEPFYELVQRQEGTDIDNLKYCASCIDGLFVVEGQTIREFQEGAHFNLTADGNIKWRTANRPSDRAIYSVYYHYAPVYRAINAVHRDRYSQYNSRPNLIQAPKVTVDGNTYVKLPEAWILKRDYILDSRDQNTYYDPNE